MSKIKLMDKSLRDMIAAGEVVERPASVVKELLENSIDAGSTAITIEIQNGGRTLIRITDNGCGIAREDVTLAFTSHATSKIKTESDLDSIETLGFRGEALSSIASVSRVAMLTKTADEQFGTSVNLEGGEITEIEDAGCPNGTTIIVRDIFFNTPARMKFLKSDLAEANAVAGIVDKLALSHPEISFKFIRDNKTALHTSGDGRLKSAVMSLYGRELADNLIEVDYSYNGLKISGLISKPIASRKSRSMQNFFLNGRYIKTKTGYAALDEGYKNSIMVGRYPSCFLNISMPHDMVDVNVHPAKTEVRFVNESTVFDAVRFAVKTALGKGDSRPTMQINHHDKNLLRKAEPEFSPMLQQRINDAIFKENKTVDNRKSLSPNMPTRESYVKPVSVISTEIIGNDETTENPAVIIPTVKPQPPMSAEADAIATHRELYRKESDEKNNPDLPPMSEDIPIFVDSPSENKSVKLIGEAFDTYILAEYGKDLMLIDKHAAHERLIFEKLRKGNIDDSGVQFLLDPIRINLPKDEYNAVIENRELFCKAGFEVDDFGDGTVILRSIPSMLLKEDAEDTVVEIAARILSNKKEITTEKLDWIYHSISCRSAIKGGDKSNIDELAEIARRALEEDIRYCPHGRPIAIILTKAEIEKEFGRIQ